MTGGDQRLVLSSLDRRIMIPTRCIRREPAGYLLVVDPDYIVTSHADPDSDCSPVAPGTPSWT